ncbi:MAG: hypothetical protein KGD63_05340 [Candidatus Lokiarchaeota archaeon]|nr:hypothetical protein [Candidatus Lokiarchaeota archaeon]
MRIHEVGIVIGGIPIIYKTYDEDINVNHNSDIICKSALMSSILNFAEIILSPMESFESNRYNVFFKKNKINSNNSQNLDFFAYVVSDKEKKSEKLKKNINTVLEKIIDEFKSQYNGDDYTEVSHYSKFNNVIDKILGQGNSTEDKFESIF